jgi:hypothetical protein
MVNNSADRVDETLGEALALYAGEPASGFEERILNGIRRRRRARRVILLQWALPILALGCSLVIFWPARPPVAARIDPSQKKSQQAEEVVLGRSVGHRVAHRQVARPKMAEFPSRVPLSQQEKALLAFVQDAPEQDLAMFRDEQPAPIPPIQIEKIEIAPLQADDQ